ncbi:MAG: hypothetical protein K0R92_729 [Lachnospiraceae bacterium]|jgi:hypothetical protein|nr:hypothetical protein [Lachnospiraceae bacterium]
MDGKKEFINESCFNINVILTVRDGDRPGCILKKEEFFLKCSERKVVCYGNPANPYLDEIQICSRDNCQFTESKLAVLKTGSPIDKLLNSSHHIVFLSAGQSLVISGCK